MFQVEDVLSEGGLFSEKMSHFEYRAGQLDMSRFVDGIISERKTGIVEAGTGIGKGMAYLTAALVAKRFPIIISTYTINLQDQLLKKDIPIMEKILGESFKSILLKGRNNYVCIRKLSRVRSFGLEATLFNRKDVKKNLKTVEKIAALEQGDRELFPFYIPQILWEEISCNSDTCFRSKCPFFKSCYFYKVRRKLANADIIVTNHSLFFKEIMPLIEKDASKYRVIIFDEAHHLKNVAQDHFTLDLSKKDFDFLARFVEKNILEKIEKPVRKIECSGILKKLYDDSKDYFSSFPKSKGFEKRIELSEDSIHIEKMVEIQGSLLRLKHILSTQDRTSNESLMALDYISSLCDKINEFIDFDDNKYVYFIEITNRSIHLKACNTDFQEQIKPRLFEDERGILFTSATLSTSGDMKYFKENLGVPEDTDEQVIDSPFDFNDQAILYIPRDIPDFKDRDFLRDASFRIEKLLEISKGRAFILFTSYSMMNSFWDYLEEPLLLKGYSPLKQEKGAAAEAIKRFHDEDKAVLFGTNRFWEGVDIPGETLSLVVIMKLPFSVPGDPVYKRYEEKVRSRNENPFMSLSLPETILKLRQGIGRLIRRKTDRGILAIMDSRIYTKAYGKNIIHSLPKMNITNDISRVRKFFE